MYILNYILLVSGVLFLIAMTLICFGLFWTPRKKQTNNQTFEEYLPTSSRSGRHIIDASDEYASDEIKDENNDLPEESETEESEGTDDTERSEAETESSSSGESEEDDDNDIEISDDTDKNADEENSEAETNGIAICVTIIDTNKKNSVVVEDEILIGRSPKCDVVVNKPMVSSAHCILIRDGKKLMAEDNHSTNGTMLNGKPLNHVVELKNNDVLTLGDRSIRINFV